MHLCKTKPVKGKYFIVLVLEVHLSIEYFNFTKSNNESNIHIIVFNPTYLTGNNSQILQFLNVIFILNAKLIFLAKVSLHKINAIPLGIFFFSFTFLQTSLGRRISATVCPRPPSSQFSTFPVQPPASHIILNCIQPSLF